MCCATLFCIVADSGADAEPVARLAELSAAAQHGAAMQHVP